jgi:4-alpha-glucanotransferase
VVPRALMHSGIGALRQLATLYGVRTSYFDIAGRKRRAEPDGLLAVLRALGAPISQMADAPGALRERVTAQWRRGAEPVVVAWGRRAPTVDLHFDAAALDRPLDCTLHREDGEVRRWRVDPSQLAVRRSVEIEGRRHVAVRLRGPAGLPWGYHRLLLEREGGASQETLILSAPRRAYRPPAEERLRSWGLFLPLYALHSQRSWGCGDLTDLEKFMAWAGGLGGRVVGTLPLLATFLDELFEPSPYVPASRLFWNEFYLDPARSPELPRCREALSLLEAPALQADLESFRAEELVDYRQIAQSKRPILEALARCFFAEAGGRGDAFRRFVEQRPALEDYARFRAVSERLRLPWQAWPSRLRDGEVGDGDFDEEARRYHLYVQFLLHEQLSALSREKGRRSAGLYLDLPLGVHTAGYDTWKEREAFAFEIYTGAPPDPLFAGGQNWGFPPLHPQRIREQGYRYVIQVLRHHLRHAAVLRVDHVMGLHRLFWIPKGFPATEGVYVRYSPEELYAILSLESHRHRVQLVGEDLGTVPPSVRRSMGRHNISGMYVIQYEATSELQDELRPITHDYLGSLNTHDMPPFAAVWYGLDLPSPQGLAPADAALVRQMHEHRQGLKAMMVALLRAGGWLTVGSSRAEVILRGLLAHLAASPAGLVMINLEDLWLERRPQNIPGTGPERPNWRRQARYSFEEFSASKAVLATLRLINRLRGEMRGERGRTDERAPVV